MADPETPSTDAAAFLGALDVGIDLKLATPASRSLAYFIDLLILWLAGAVLLLVAVLAGTNLADLGVEPGPFFAALLIGWFSFEGLWFTCWEWLGGGRTPGKRAMGLRVVRKNGYAVGLGGALIRTLLRPIELGTSGSIAMLVASLTPLHQRLGDLAGGTLVIQDQQGSAPRATSTRWPDGVADTDVELLEAWFDRAPVMATGARKELAKRILKHVDARYPGFIEPAEAVPAERRLAHAFGIAEA